MLKVEKGRFYDFTVLEIRQLQQPGKLWLPVPGLKDQV